MNIAEMQVHTDGLITEHGGAEVIEPFYAPLEPLERIVEYAAGVELKTVAEILEYTFQQLRDAI